MSNKITIPGTFVSIFECGCLLTGASLMGKSELALNLLDRGHAFISDDVTEFFVDDGHNIIGQAPALLKNRLLIREIGLIDVSSLFGTHSVKKTEKLHTIIELRPSLDQIVENPLSPNLTDEKILGISIPKLIITINKHRELALILETFVKNGILSDLGTHALREFTRDHEQQLEANHL